jgi:phosphatidylinositol 4-kinase
MNIREFEVLLALCKAAPLLQQGANRLAEQLSPYLLEAHTQRFVPSPSLRDIEPSPVESLTYNLTMALLSLGINHEIQVSDTLWEYLKICYNITSEAQGATVEDGSSPEVEDAIQVATITLSLLGFLDAAATYANFWTSSERLMLIERIQTIVSTDFLVAVETAFSTIRNSNSHEANVKEWKRYVRRYAAAGRPLGAMLLRRSFMWLLVASSSLLLADIRDLSGNDILEVLVTTTGGPEPTFSPPGDVDFETIEIMADIAADEMAILEEGADYLQMGSAWDQKLGYSVKAAALTSYLNCAFLNEDAADPEFLMTWLEDTLADSIQMADETLAKVVLRGMALISKISSAFAPNISRILPRFIVQGGPRGQTVEIASISLTYVLQLLSPDAIITTLYTLGNVLSSSSNAERALAGGVNGDLTMDSSAGSNFYAGKQSTGSSITLPGSGEEETSLVYGNVIQAICSIATSCNEPKITALAQSMLLQKIDKISRAIDTRIITEAAALALSGGPQEFKSLLKLYSRVIQEGVLQNNNLLLEAVSLVSVFLIRLWWEQDTELYRLRKVSTIFPPTCVKNHLYTISTWSISSMP